MLKRLNTAGDTIVEVMIVLAVLGLAISISYVTANRSLLNTRQAQENSAATRILQSQVEGLRIVGAAGPSAPSPNVYDYGSAFCIDNSGATLGYVPVANSVCNNVENHYNLSILYCPGNGSADCAALQSDGTFLLRATWDNVRGAGTDSVTFVYRYHGKWD